MTRGTSSVYGGLFLVCLLFAWGAEAQQAGPNAPTPKLANINDIKVSAPVSATGASDGSGGVTGPSVTLGLTSSSVTITPGSGLSGGGAVALGGSITLNLVTPFSTAQLPGTTAYTDASNIFTANQSINANLNVTGNIALPSTNSSGTAGMLTLGGSPFLHGFGTHNTFVGQAGNLNGTNTGSENTATGYSAFVSNTTGSGNTATGFQALGANSTGNNNTATGFDALTANTTGGFNTAIGTDALTANTDGHDNVAIGFNALASNTSVSGTPAGSNNVAIGSAALSSNTTGNNNIAIGVSAGNTGGGVSNGDANIYIGNINFSTIGPAIQGENNTMRIGFSPLQTRAFIGGINGVMTGLTGTAVVVDGNGQLGTISSSRRFKDDIHDMDEASMKLLQLRPVTFRYKQAQSDGSHPLQYGLIAEEVADVYPELVQNSPKGEPNAVLYHVLPAMLLNEFQKQHRTMEAQEEQIHSLQEQVVQLAAQTRQLQLEVAASNAQRGRGSELAAVTTHGR